jgi:hypothetical protein
MLKKILIGVGLLVVAVVAYGVIEGKLKVGDPAPDVALLALDGTTPVRLKDSVGGKPLILVFGSFT